MVPFAMAAARIVSSSLGYVVQHHIPRGRLWGTAAPSASVFIVGVREGLAFEFPEPTFTLERDPSMPRSRSAPDGRLHMSPVGRPSRTSRRSAAPRQVSYRHHRARMPLGLRGQSRQVTGHDTRAPPLGEAHAALISQVPQGGT